MRQHEQQQSQQSMWSRYVLMNQHDWPVESNASISSMAGEE